MSAHVTEWLAAYQDGELGETRRAQVEAHLAICLACQTELDELRELSALIREAPSPEPRLSPRQFRSQVMLRLPPDAPRPGWQRTLKAGWNLAPLGAVLVWVGGQAIWLVASLGALLSLPLGPVRSGYLGGLLNMPAPPVWLSLERAFQLGLVNLVFTSLVAVFLLGWLASWWLTVWRPSQNEVEQKLTTRTQLHKGTK